MVRKRKTARAVHANRGIESRYRAALTKLIAEMHGSLSYWITAAYRKAPPRLLELAEMAQDAAPSAAMRKTLDELRRRWTDRFDEMAPKLAELYMRDTFKASEGAFRSALKDAGWAVDFTMTPTMRDALQAVIDANVGLIRSIPEKYLGQVEGAVMRSYSQGRDLGALTKELQTLYPKAAHRAVLIARDQCNKANSVVNRTRQLELNLTRGIWQHSHGGKEPRPSHVAADGSEFDIAKGKLIDGKYIMPGEEIECRCTWRVVLPIPG